MLKKKTHKDAFKAFLAPEKYEESSCGFCDEVWGNCDDCAIQFYCERGYSDINGVRWPTISFKRKREIIRYVLRYCRKWDQASIERVARKKAIALGVKIKTVKSCS